jgi:3-phenylpropionate/trans-cinnamate dioxygenase ferredoxin reductase component
MPKTHTILIVGGGLAAAKAAETLRAEGFDGRIALATEERELPYERPPLSKEYLQGKAPRDGAHVHPAAFYVDNDIDLLTGTAVERIDAGARDAELSDGSRIRWDRLLLATGSVPRRLPVPGADLAGVHYLRSLEDADELRDRAAVAARAVVIGAGWIGAEAAASLRMRGLEVALVEQANAPLERVLGPEVGSFYAGLHRRNGVELLTGSVVERIEGAGAVERVHLYDGRTLEADLVVVGVGVTPRCELAESAGLLVSRGIEADDQLETSASGVFAAGDAAYAAQPFYGRPLRVEHWATALHQGETAARNMLGRNESYDRLPYFFSDQYDAGMEYIGFVDRWDEVVFRGDPAGGEFMVFWLGAGQVQAGMAVNVWEQMEAVERLIRSRRPVDPQVLRDADTPLEELTEATRV